MMSHAGEFLRRFCESSKVDQREIALKAGLSEGHFSKILKGDRKLIREGTLLAILDVLPPNHRGGFLRAHLLDTIPESYHEFITDKIDVGRIKEESDESGKSDPFTELAGTFRRSFRSPKREKIIQMVERLVENCAVSPDFLRGMELLAKLEIK